MLYACSASHGAASVPNIPASCISSDVFSGESSTRSDVAYSGYRKVTYMTALVAETSLSLSARCARTTLREQHLPANAAGRQNRATADADRPRHPSPQLRDRAIEFRAAQQPHELLPTS